MNSTSAYLDEPDNQTFAVPDNYSFQNPSQQSTLYKENNITSDFSEINKAMENKAEDDKESFKPGENLFLAVSGAEVRVTKPMTGFTKK